MLTQEQDVELKEKRKINELENQLKKKDDQNISQKARVKKERKLNAPYEDNPELFKSLNVRPRIEQDQSDQSSNYCQYCYAWICIADNA